jgi:hypothetical protein
VFHHYVRGLSEIVTLRHLGEECRVFVSRARPYKGEWFRVIREAPPSFEFGDDPGRPAWKTIAHQGSTLSFAVGYLQSAAPDDHRLSIRLHASPEWRFDFDTWDRSGRPLQEQSA